MDSDRCNFACAWTQHKGVHSRRWHNLAPQSCDTTPQTAARTPLSTASSTNQERRNYQAPHAPPRPDSARNTPTSAPTRRGVQHALAAHKSGGARAGSPSKRVEAKLLAGVAHGKDLALASIWAVRVAAADVGADALPAKRPAAAPWAIEVTLAGIADDTAVFATDRRALPCLIANLVRRARL